MLQDLIQRIKKQDRAEMAFRTGVSIDTIRAIVSGRNSNPLLKTVVALSEYCNQKEKEADDAKQEMGR